MFNNKTIKYLVFILISFVSILVSSFIFSQSANARVVNVGVTPPQVVTNGSAPVNCQTADTQGNGIWGINGTVLVRLVDENGNVSFASDYTVKIDAIDTVTNSPSGAIGVGYNPYTAQGSRLNLAQVTVNANNRKACTLFDGKIAYPLVIDSGYSNAANRLTNSTGTDNLSLDCWYENGRARNKFIISGESINQPGWENGNWTIKQETLIQNGGSSDLNNSSFNFILEFTKLPVANVQVSKYLPGNAPLGQVATNPTIVNAPVTIGGNVPGFGNVNVVNSQPGNPVRGAVVAPVQAYTQVDTPVGYKLCRITVDRQQGTNEPKPDIQQNDCNSPPPRLENISTQKDETIYVNYFYDPDPTQVSYYPWLQTLKGDVESQGKITGQKIGTGPPFNTDPRGARHSSSAGKNQPNAEAEFVIASALDGSNFCSGNLYTLGTKQSEVSGSCAIKPYGLAQVDFASIKTTINDTFNRNGAGGTGGSACKPYNTKTINGSVDVNTNDVSCVGGTIFKKEGNLILVDPTPGDGKFDINGRNTLWVKGNVNINTNIEYVRPVGAVAANRFPNFAIFVEGDVDIDQTVTKIDAIVIATGKIRTCSQSGNREPVCTQRLVINGYLASGNNDRDDSGVWNDFGRRHFLEGAPNINSAELIVLTGQSIVFPPPGLGKQDGEASSQLQFNLGELPPRLN